MPLFISVLTLTALGSMVGPLLVALMAGATAVALSIKVLNNDSGYRTSLLLIVGAFGFPLAALRWGESSSLITTSSLVLATGAVFVFTGLKPKAVLSQSHLMFRVLTTGFLLSYLPLIRSMSEGLKLMWTFLLTLSAMYLAYRLSANRFTTRSQRWIPWVTALVASMAMGAASLLYMPNSFYLLPMLILAMSVASAGLLGAVIEEAISAELPDLSPWWRGLGPLLFAAPAFFYTFRLYLT